MVEYLDANTIQGTRETREPIYQETASGYGKKLRSHYMVRVANRWHRVYIVQWANAGSAYIMKAGKALYLDGDCEHRIKHTIGRP